MITINSFFAFSPSFWILFWDRYKIWRRICQLRPFLVLKSQGDLYIWIQELKKHWDLKRHVLFLTKVQTLQFWDLFFLNNGKTEVSVPFFLLWWSKTILGKNVAYLILNFDGSKQASFSLGMPFYLTILHIALIVCGFHKRAISIF